MWFGDGNEDIEALVHALTHSQRFQRWCNVSDWKAAESFVHFGAIREPEGYAPAIRPFALIEDDEHSIDINGVHDLYEHGTLALVLGDNDRHQGDFRSSFFEFRGTTRLIMREIADASGLNDNLVSPRISRGQTPIRSSPVHEEGYWHTRYLIPMGVLNSPSGAAE